MSARDTLLLAQDRLRDAVRLVADGAREADSERAPAQLWRPVVGNKPELPHPGEIVICYANGDMFIGELAVIQKVGVTHWMPLPPRPWR